MIGYVSPQNGKELSSTNDALVTTDGQKYPVVNGIPRFVSSELYASAFGLQWTVHAKTQLDSALNGDITKKRLERCFGFPLKQLAGLDILEAGAGAGRFTEILISTGANVHSIDLSVAVDSNKKNIGEKPNYVIAQADIRHIPYPNEAFDVVMCLGVIQHTPNPEETIRSLWSKVKPGGLLVIDHYKFKMQLLWRPDHIYRQILKRLKPETSKKIVNKMVDILFPLHWKWKNNYFMKVLLGRISACLVYFDQFPELTYEQHYDLTKLDTYDHLTDFYKHYRTEKSLVKTMAKLGAVEIHSEDNIGNGVELRCRKPKNG